MAIDCYSNIASGVSSDPLPQRGQRTAFLRREGESRGASPPVDMPMDEDPQPHDKGKRLVKLTERAK
jgi:hypothetical protein